MQADGISIVIPAYNEEKFLPATLASVNESRARFTRSSGLPSELIVVDNASTDRTREVASGLGATVVPHAIRNISSVRNAGIRAARFDLIVSIDADCFMPPDALEKILEHMSDESRIGAALGVQLISSKLVNRVAAAVIQFFVSLISGITGAMFVFRKKAALAIGGFPEDMLVAEDSAFALSMQKYGREHGRTFGVLKAVRIGTLDRKEIGPGALPALFVQVTKAFFGVKQTTEELPFWYKPDR